MPTEVQNKLKADVVVVGAGLLGSSVAMHLVLKQPNLKVIVLDLDLDGVYSSSELNAGGVRATWNQPVNAALSQISIEYYEKVASEIGFRQKGYLWMYSKEDWPVACKVLKANRLLNELGVEYLEPADLKTKYSFIDKLEDLGGATFSPKDGLINPNLLKLHYRKKAKERGVEFLNRVWVHEVDVNPIRLEAWQWDLRLSLDEIKGILEKDIEVRKLATEQSAENLQIEAKILVNCSGAWARRFATCLKVKCLSEPIRRQVSIFEAKGLDLNPYGMFVDCSGVYFHAEANNILAGFAVPDEEPGYNFEYEGDVFFQEHIWTSLYERSSFFESLRHISGWAGLYEVSPDKSAIIGQVPGFSDVYELHSFSGRGAMQSYGAGLALAELLVDGAYKSCDLTPLRGDRFEFGKLLKEDLLI